MAPYVLTHLLVGCWFHLHNTHAMHTKLICIECNSHVSPLGYHMCYIDESKHMTLFNLTSYGHIICIQRRQMALCRWCAH